MTLLNTTLLILTVTLGLMVSPADAVVQSGPLTWSPFGPRTENLVMTVYGDLSNMFLAFEQGKIDITDWPVSFSDEPRYEGNPDFWISDRQGGGAIFEVDFNHHNSFMGIQMQEPRGSDSFNSPSTEEPTAAGIEIRRALAHLLDKPDFITSSVAGLGGRAEYDDIQSPPRQGLTVGGAAPSKLPQSVLDEDCEAHSWFNPGDCHPVSAYNLVSDSLPDPFSPFADHGWSGPDDLRAACDHLMAAGFTIAPSSATCAEVATADGGAHLVPIGQVDFYIRSHPPRRAFGQIVKDAIDFVFGTPCTARYGTRCAIYYFTITEVVDFVFNTREKDDWHLYTAGWFLGEHPDHLYALYHSSFASNACGGKRSSFAQNYVFYCDPQFDQEAAAGNSAMTLSDAILHFENAALEAHRTVMTVPVYSNADVRAAALNGWNWQPGTESSLAVGPTGGFLRARWSLLNMRARPSALTICDANGQPSGCTTNPIYLPGGGNPNLIRRGLSHPILRPSPFTALTIWDFEVIDQVYDTLLAVNPTTTGAGQQLFDWMTVRHSSSFDPNTDVTTQIWVLRNDLKWHDGVPVTAADVAYTILAYRDLPSSVIQPAVFPVTSATALDSRTVQVRLTGQSIFYESNIGGVPIIPKHKWAPFCGDPPSTGSICADPSFDPMNAGIYVGSGPWVCKNVNTGVPGGSCTMKDGVIQGQEVTMGGEIRLTRYGDYMRSVVSQSSLHKFSWADRNNDAKVDILDIADAAVHFGSPDPYWNTGQNPQAPFVGTDASKVDIGELATVAFYFSYALTRPYAPSQLLNVDPDIDPFF